MTENIRALYPDGGTDPAYVTSMEFFDSMTHEEMYTKSRTIRTADIARLAAGWGSEAVAVTAAFARFDAALNHTVGDRWGGSAADRAIAAIAAFLACAADVGRVMSAVHERLRAVERGSAEVVSRIPPPVPAVTGIDLFAPGGGKAVELAREEARLEAVRVLNGFLLPTCRTAGEGVPKFAAAHDPTCARGPATDALGA
jgi:hypothetical protein